MSQTHNKVNLDSTNSTNGCLLFIGQIFVAIIIITLLPYAVILSLLWWPFAWILGLLFPGRDFFPIKRIWTGFKEWMHNHLDMDVESILLFMVLFLVAGSIIGGLVNLFRKN